MNLQQYADPRNKGAVSPAPARSSAQRESALALARRGFRVFPVIPNDKRPLIKGWQAAATCDRAQIDAWWRETSDANIGLLTERLLVVDLDPRNGSGATIQALTKEKLTFPDSLASVTAGGGAHLIFALPEGVRVKSKTHALGKGVDIKSHGGYIVAAGSTIGDKKYEWLRSPTDTQLALAPQWILDRCEPPEEKPPLAGKRIVDEDENTIARIEHYLARRAPEAVEGERDLTAYKVACEFYDEGATLETATEYLLQWNESKCHPPLDRDIIEIKARSALTKRQNTIGSKAPNAGGFEPVEIEARPAAAEVPSSNGSRFPFTQPFDSTALPQRPWVVPGFACRGRVSMLAGPGGVAKSTYSLMLAVAAATGRDDICGFKVPTPVRAAVWNQEDDLEEMQRRLAAIMAAYEVSWADLVGADGESMLCINSGVENPLILAQRTMEGGIRVSKAVTEIVEEVCARNIGLLILDPLVELHEAVENDNVQMRSVMSIVREIAVRGDCAVLLDTHTKKPPVANSDGFAGEMDAARGASSQSGVIRVGATLFSASLKDAKKWRMTGSHLDYVRLDIAKNNLARRTGEPIWFKRDSVRVGSFEAGEDVGVLRPIDLQPAAHAGHDDLLETIAGAISENLSPRVGHPLSTLIPHLAATAAAPLAGKNRARVLDEAFGGKGVTEYLTTAGMLKRTHGGGNKGVLLSLIPAPHSSSNQD